MVALIIISNGVMVGFQSDEEHSTWPGLDYLEVGFALFLILEILLRMALMQGVKFFFCGPECWWNYFDVILAASGLVDMALHLGREESGDVFATSLLRFCRLIRLVRIVKVFRLKIMKDLRLMVKGLVAGIKTLIMAFILLFTSLRALPR